MSAHPQHRGADESPCRGVGQYPGHLTIIKSTIARNRAPESGVGGVYLYESSARIVASTISGNVAGDGGSGGIGVSAGSSLVMANSTVASNQAADDGGGIEATGSGSEVVLRNVTVARNLADSESSGFYVGGGLFGQFGAQYSIVNSIIAKNRAGSGLDDCSADSFFDSDGGNLVSHSEGCSGFEFGNGDFLRPAPKLGELANNGGPTKTIALRRGSPAIGKARKDAAPKRDQRGRRRDAKPDIGAYER